MCGRYYVDDGTWSEIRKICHGIDEAKLNVRSGDVRPTDFALVLSGGKEIRAEQMHWGFASPYRDGLLINARVETATTKVSFRNSIRNCRCGNVDYPSAPVWKNTEYEYAELLLFSAVSEPGRPV